MILATRKTTKTATKPLKSGYAPVNGLQMYYEIHGKGGTPLVLLHGGFSAIGTSFGKLLPTLAKTRQVIGVDMQGHGHTADIDRPLRFENLADDIAALLGYLEIPHADIFGYSVGAGVALHLAIRHPAVVRKLVLATVSYLASGMQPGLLEGMAYLQPEMMHGSPWHDEYMHIAPHPEDFPKLVNKVKEFNANVADLAPEQIRSIKAPVLLIFGDSDIVQLEHVVDIFRLLGGGIEGTMGLPNSQLAVLPGTAHQNVIDRAEVLLAVIPPFLDAPMPTAK